jgi:hypothetical protein
MRCFTIHSLHTKWLLNTICFSFASVYIWESRIETLQWLYQLDVSLGLEAVWWTWLVCEWCLVGIAIMRKLVSLRKPTVARVNRFNRMAYLLVFSHTYILTMYGYSLGRTALDMMLSTLCPNLVRCIVTLVTEYSCDKLFCKVLQRFDTVNAEEWPTGVCDRYPAYGFLFL